MFAFLTGRVMSLAMPLMAVDPVHDTGDIGLMLILLLGILTMLLMWFALLVIVLVGIAMAAVLATVLIMLGIISTSFIVGLLSRRASHGVNAFIIQACGFFGCVAGMVVLFTVNELLPLGLTAGWAVLAGAVWGFLIGLMTGFTLTVIWSHLRKWLLAKLTAGRADTAVVPIS